MNNQAVYFSFPALILVTLGVIALSVLAGWMVGQQRERKNLSRQLTATLNALPDGAMIVRTDGQIVMANTEARQLWGAQPFPSRLQGAWVDLARQVCETGAHSAQNLDAPSTLKLSVKAAPLYSDLALFALQDLSARQRQEIFYRNFINNVSHELKTPLTVIQGHIAAMSDHPVSDDRWQTWRRIVAEEAIRLTQLVDNLLLLSRLERPDFSLQIHPMNLEAVVEDAILQLSDLAEARGISISLQKNTVLPHLMADRAQLKQVFINLLDNAIKYNREGGEVIVQLDAGEEHVTAQVIDTGEGIPAQDLPHIFEKMYRVERRRGRPVEGSGLGLSIVQHIVDQHGGAISVKSREGETTFTVTLPRST